MQKKLRGKSSLFYVLTLLIIVGSLFYRMSDLTRDPPMFFSGLSQSFSTDPGQYVHHARNSVLYGDSDPFDYPRWKVYQRSLTSATAYLWFSIAGVSLKQANTVGVILSIAALIFFVLATTHHHRPWVTAAIAFVGSINVCLTVYGRLSYLENGLLLLTALLFFVYSRWGEKLWGLIVAGLLAALAMLIGKLFGALLVPAVLLAVYFSDKQRRWKSVAATLVSFVVSVVLLIVILYGTDIGTVVGYFKEQSFGLRGAPAGLTSPWGFIEHLVSFGFDNRLFFLSLDLELFLLLGGLLLTMFFLKGEGISRMSPIGRLSMFAAGCIILGLMPLNYSPLRYALFLIPSILLFSFTIVDDFTRGPTDSSGRARYVYFLPLFMIIWNTLYQLIGITFFMNDVPTRPLVWATLPGALLISLLAWKFLVVKHIRLTRRQLYVALSVLLAFSLGLNIHRTIKRVRFHQTYNFLECGEDLRSILGDDAVVSGPYAPVLTMNNDLRCFIHLFGVATVDSTLFDRYPITHLAIDQSNWAEAIKQYPVLEGLPPTTAFVIRDFTITICNISKLFGNPEANRYQETGYERASAYYQRKQLDSAFVELSGFLKDHPLSRSGNLFLADILFARGNQDEALAIMTELVKRTPTDYYTNLACGRLIQIRALTSGDRRLEAMAKRYYQKAIALDPFRAKSVNDLYEQTRRQYLPVDGP